MFNKFTIFILCIVLFSCNKTLDISEFSDDYASYKSELRIEAIILPKENTAIVRIDRSVLIDEETLFNCQDDDGDWDPLTDDVGSDGIDSNESNFGWVDPDEDNTEGNGLPDCGEPHIDEYDEILPNIHVKNCNVQITYNNMETCTLHYYSEADSFYYSEGAKIPTMDEIETVHYGAYIPSEECRDNDFNWQDYEGEYTFSTLCPEYSEYGVIRSNKPIQLSMPVVFYNEHDDESMKTCDSYECLEDTSTILDTVYFAKFSSDQYIYYASLLESSYYQAVQYHLDKTAGEYKITHEHPDQATDEENIWGNICLMQEKVVTDILDGDDDGVDEADISIYEMFTFSKSFTNYYFFDMLDIRDPVRTNLRDQNGIGNPVMGTFGSMTSNRIFLRIIDCELFPDETNCNTNSKGVCEWDLNNEDCGIKFEN